MERNEMIEKLVKKANVNSSEAEEVLEKCDWDLLDAVIYLERKSKGNDNKTIDIITTKEGNNDKKERCKKDKSSCDGVGKIMGKIFKFIGGIIKKGNKIFFKISKEDEEPIKISLTVSVLLLIILFVPSIVLLVIGLFSGYKYSLVGLEGKYEGVNSVFNEASKSADSIKKDFKMEYKK